MVKIAAALQLQPFVCTAIRIGMELDPASIAIGRIERALSRLERADLVHASAAAVPRQGDLLRPVAPPANDALRSEVRAVIAELDKLIAEAGGG
jgi:hypothetical protein